MPIPTPTLRCASATFIARIADPARRGKAVDLTLGAPGFANPEWLRGAYITTLARNKREGLSTAARAAIGHHVATWPLAHLSKAAFDHWHSGEITALSGLVAHHDPSAFWSYGRSQKFINILLKYACTAFHSGLPHFAAYRAGNLGIGAMTPWLHAPVDRYTLKHAANLPRGTSGWRYLAWSKMLTPRHYSSIQTALAAASATKGISPIHYEMVFVW
jgi:hypothetical protein